MRIYRSPTRVTPEVDFNLDDGFIKLRGVSSPENSLGFYAPLLKAVKHPAINLSKLNVEISFSYVNTSSSKCIYDLLKETKSLRRRGVEVSYTWFYEEDDEDMMECGEDFSDFLGIDMQFVEVIV